MPHSLENSFFHFHPLNSSLKSSLLYHHCMSSMQCSSLCLLILLWLLLLMTVSAPTPVFFQSWIIYHPPQPSHDEQWEVGMRSGFNLWTGTLSNAKGSLSWDGKLRNKTSKDLERDMAGNINRTPWQAYFFLDFLWVFFPLFHFFLACLCRTWCAKKKKVGKEAKTGTGEYVLRKKKKTWNVL